MNILLFVILPIATILIAIVLQKVLHSPILVAILTFAIYLILAYTVFASITNFLLYAIVYTLLAFVTAVLTRLFCCIIKRINICNNDEEETLQESIQGLNDNIEILEDNINNLTDLISTLITGNSCSCCNRRLK